MTTCTTCGEELAEGAAFCTSCGTSTSAADEESSAVVQPTAAEPPVSSDPWATAPAPSPASTPPHGPMPPSAAPPAAASSGSGKLVAVVVGVAVLLLVAAGGIAVALLAGGGDEDEAAPAATTTTAEQPSGDEGDADPEDADDPVDDEPGEDEEEPAEEFEAPPAFDGAAPVNLFDLQVGHCVEEDLGFLFGGVYDLTLVDCATPHRAEMYHRFDLPDGPFPGDAALEAAGDACYQSAFSDYVGVAWDYSEVYASFFVPDQQTWDAGVHTILCFAHELDTNVTSTVSVRNSGR